MSHNPPPTGLSMHNLAAEVTLTELVNMNHSFALSFPDCQAFGAMSGIEMFGSFGGVTLDALRLALLENRKLLRKLNG